MRALAEAGSRGSRLVAMVALGWLTSAAPGVVRAATITLAPFADGLSGPVAIANAGDSRLFVVEKSGYIRIVESDGTLLGTPFLDIHTLVSGGSEQGLLGLAFHPNYASNGFFYVDYTDTAGNTAVMRYEVSGDPDLADSLSATPVLSQSQPFVNHNGGGLAFGPDGYLYISLGDGGAGCDPGDRAQDPTTILGKLLRIDVDSGSPYAIPPSNPFAGSMTAREEIWLTGLRNPWRFSFDRSNGDLYVADVGQNRLEEVDFQIAGSPGGNNFGWNCYEGNDLSSVSPSSCTSMATCAPSSLFVFPVHQYDHSGGRCSITGGFVYRGSLSPTLAGHYFFADFCSSDLYSLTTPDNGATWNLESHGVPVSGLSPTTFGEDSSGEVYVTGFNGTIYRLEETAPPPTCPVEPQTGCTATAKAGLKIKTGNDPAKNKLIWKWQNGPALAQGDFGDPAGNSTSYSFCLYAGTSVAIAAGIPAQTGWSALSTKGYKFSEPSGNGDGISKVSLKGGAAGKSKILIKGKGANLNLTALPLNVSTQVLVQLIRGDDPACWEATFPAAAVNRDDAEQFKAKIP